MLGAIPLTAAVEKLTPPSITGETIDQRITCIRPMREGKFNISVEDIEEKIVVHCYGHGGSGCTTSFGSVARAIDLFTQKYPNKKGSHVRVLGAGIIGLTAAVELARLGYSVRITAEEIYDIPSFKNAGYFALVSVRTDPEEQENLKRIGMKTFEEYKTIHEGKHPYISKECIKYLPVYSSADTESGVEDLEACGLIPKREPVTIDFGNGVTHPGFNKFYTYFMDTTRIMLDLHREVERLGITIENKKVAAFEEFAEDIIFDCSGLGGKELNNDKQMVPVRGHLVNLNKDSGTDHMNYMIYTKVKGYEGNQAYVYMFPKCLQVSEQDSQGREVYGTLGGTFIKMPEPKSEAELAKLDADEFRKMLDRNCQFFFGKKFDQ